MSLTKMDKKIINGLQGDLPIESRPFAKIAQKLGIEEKELLKHIKNFIENGIIRRFGATIFHHRSGFEANAMVAWKVPPDRLKEVGETIATFPEVTHCYARITHSNWPYNLYTMVHGRTEQECINIVKKIATAAKIKHYQLLFTEDTFKRTSPQYF
ncbi:MAG: Lrp/AsnC family transcriptional regulator [Candidatus Desulfofervidus auxilii]|nr:Lrp/AsnC family transcriptional regulator [Candidatus Desulfofervidus auxilii]